MINPIGKKVLYTPNNQIGAKAQLATITEFFETGNGKYRITVSSSSKNIRMQYPEAFETFLTTDDPEILTDLQQIYEERHAKKLLEEEAKRLEQKEKDDIRNRIKEEAARLKAEDEEQKRRIRKEQTTNAYSFLTNERNIKYLVHFTTVNNLLSILKTGILPRNDLPDTAEVMDQNRFDNMQDCSCFTVSFPNNLFFYKLRNENPTKAFVVLKIDPTIIRDKQVSDVFFTHANAANNQFNGIRQMQTGLYYAKSLFYDKNIEITGTTGEMKEVPLRKHLQIPNHYSTNPQAEILIRGAVDTKYIKGICVDSYASLEQLKSKLPQEYFSKLEINSGLFNKRNDTWYWSTGNYG